MQLDEFTNAYLECALWTSTDTDGESLDGLYTLDDFSPAARESAIEDCADFQKQFYDLIDIDLERAGRDFWLIRNRHGAGFWDGDWPGNTGRILTEASRPYGGVELYVGQDGLIHQY